MNAQEILKRRQEILFRTTGINYARFNHGPVAFDYESLMNSCGYATDEIMDIQRDIGVGNTPIVELKNITALVRHYAKPGKGARIFVKDEAANPSGSFKDRRASLPVYHAWKNGYPGVVAATSGNYGAAVASQASKRNLPAIVLQETFDSNGVGQPEILEKGRACQAYGAEVIQLTVGPELFAVCLDTLDKTEFFNASLYTPFAVVGVETLGFELATQIRAIAHKFPESVVVTHAGGGNITGTARGLKKAGATGTKVIGVSVDLTGLHMASDRDFNRKSFTTGHTGFGIPFATWPDRSDVPINAARPLRYMDEYYTVTQGEVFFITEALAQLEGLQRGPAGNTSLAAACVLAAEMDQEEIIVVQETEYTGAGKHHTSQLAFAKEMGVKVIKGSREKDKPGETIAIPEDWGMLGVTPVDLKKLRRSYLKKALGQIGAEKSPTAIEIEFWAKDLNTSAAWVEETIEKLQKEE